jgi:hypothetical protein
LQKEAQSIPLTQIHDRSLSWLGTDTSIKSGGAKSPLLGKWCCHASAFQMWVKLQLSNINERTALM